MIKVLSFKMAPVLANMAFQAMTHHL